MYAMLWLITLIFSQMLTIDMNEGQKKQKHFKIILRQLNKVT